MKNPGLSKASHQTHIGDGCLRVKWPNQQCHSAEGR